MAENDEREDLDALVRHPGWARFTDMVNSQWSASSEWFLEQLDNALKTDNPNGHEHFRQIRASQREIQKALKMPSDRIKALETKEVPQYVASRRGSL